MNELSHQIVSHLLDGEDQNETLLFDRVVSMFSPDHGPAQVIDHLLMSLIIIFG